MSDDSRSSKPVFDLDRLRAIDGLADVAYRPATASTNDWALDVATDDEQLLPLLVLTGKQTSGRGRGANQWWSASGTLTFSVLVDAHALRLPFERWPLVALTTGLAVCEALSELDQPGTIGLKWPNDVYVAGRKVCGILVEAPSHARGRVVIGVGINVNNSFHAAPEEIRQRATSLCDVAGKAFELNAILTSVVQHIFGHLQMLVNDDSIASRFRAYCLLTGKMVYIQHGLEQIVGMCRGIDEQGALLVQTAAAMRRLVSGTVTHFK